MVNRMNNILHPQHHHRLYLKPYIFLPEYAVSNVLFQTTGIILCIVQVYIHSHELLADSLISSGPPSFSRLLRHAREGRQPSSQIHLFASQINIFPIALGIISPSPENKMVIAITMILFLLHISNQGALIHKLNCFRIFSLLLENL